MGKYQLSSNSFPALEGEGAHHGTGLIKNAKNIVMPDTVAKDFREQLGFTFKPYSIRVLSLEISDKRAPNWFGVAFRENITSFGAINIFFHPSPGTAGMQDNAYQTRSGLWPRLFRYAEMFGSQLDFANSNQVMIVPFFDNASYSTTGLFGPDWEDICTDILSIARNEALQLSDGKQAAITDVVLSNFSFGRALMYNFLAKSNGIDRCLREIWDFDGVSGAPPYSVKGARGILYDQKQSNDPHNFHVPGN